MTVRKKNPRSGWHVRMGKSLKRMKLVWTAQDKEDAIFIARTFAKANPRNFVDVIPEVYGQQKIA